MTAQGMLDAIIRAMDEKITAVVDRLDNLEERIPFSGAWSPEYEEKVDAAIDVKLSPVLDRLDLVEEQLRQLTGKAPEPAGAPKLERVSVSVPAESVPENADKTDRTLSEADEWDPAEYWDYVLGLEELAERLERLECSVDARLALYAEAVGVSVETEPDTEITEDI